MKSIINALKKEGKRAPPELRRSRTGNWRQLQVDGAAPWSASPFVFVFFLNFFYFISLIY